MQYAVLGQVQEGDRLPVTGISPNRTWLQVQTEAARRWIFADLTDVTAELRADLAEVAAPALEGSVSASTGQSSSAAPAKPAATATPVPAPETVYHAPGTYDRALYPGLRYEWELTFTDNSELWDWEIVDFQGCYDAIRVYMGELPAERGLQRVEMVLSDPFVEQNLHSYADDSTRRINSYFPTPSRDLNRFFALWPDWYEGNLPHPDFAYVSGICIPSTRPRIRSARYIPCGATKAVSTWTAQPANAMAAGLGTAHIYGPVRSWLDARYTYMSFLAPMDARGRDPAGHGPCIRLTKNF